MGYAGDITRMNIKAPSTIENKGPLSAAGGVVLDAPPEHESFDEKIARLKEQLKACLRFLASIYGKTRQGR